MRRLAVVVGLGGLALAAACASLSGLSGGEATTAPDEAGAEAAPIEAGPPPDPCSHASYPLPPTKDDDPIGEVPPFVVAVREESVNGELDGGAPMGFDLDGVCTCFSDKSTAHGGGPSCVAPEGGMVACDGDGGADRQIGALLAAYAVPDNGSSAGATLLLKITRYNGRANDAEVFVGFVASSGVFDRSGCGAGGGGDAGAGPYPPTWKGCDLFALDSESVLPGSTEPAIYFPAYVTGNVLVVPPTEKPITLVLGTTSLRVTSAIVSARLIALDAQLQPIVPPPDVGKLFHLEGIAAGRVGLTDALRGFATAQALTDGGPLCGVPNFFNSVKNTFICPGADITTSAGDDFKNVGCDALSLAAAFTADPAQFGAVRKPDPSACADPNNPKFAPFFDCTK